MSVKLRYAVSAVLTVLALLVVSCVIAYLMYMSGMFLELHFTLLTNMILLFCFAVEKKYLPQAVFISVSIPVLGAVLVTYAVITYNSKTYRLQKNMKFLDEYKDEFLLFEKSGSDKAKLFDRSDKLYNSMLKDIKNAKRSVFILSYIVEDGKATERLIKAIGSLKLSVKVTIVADYFGSSGLSGKTVKLLKKLKVKIKYFNKPNIFLTLADNLRLHAKFLCVDGETAYFSSLNIGDEFVYRERDFGIRVFSPNMINVENTFKSICRLAPLPKVKSRKKVGSARTLSSVFDKKYQALPMITFGDKLKNLYICLLLSAKSRIKIISPYVSIDDRLFEVFSFLVTVGVEVSLIVPSVNCYRKRKGASKYSCNDLLTAGVNVYAAEKFIHAKILVIDESIALSGSANMDERSLGYAVESSLIIKDSGLIDGLISSFDAALISSRKLDKENIENNIIEGQKKNFSKLLSPLV